MNNFFICGFYTRILDNFCNALADEYS